MDDDIDAAELLGRCVGDRRAALDSGDIRSHEQLLRGHSVGSRAGGGEDRCAHFAQSRRHRPANSPSAAGDERPVAFKFAGAFHW